MPQTFKSAVKLTARIRFKVFGLMFVLFSSLTSHVKVIMGQSQFQTFCQFGSQMWICYSFLIRHEHNEKRL